MYKKLKPFGSVNHLTIQSRFKRWLNRCLTLHPSQVNAPKWKPAAGSPQTLHTWFICNYRNYVIRRIAVRQSVSVAHPWWDKETKRPSRIPSGEEEVSCGTENGWEGRTGRGREREGWRTGSPRSLRFLFLPQYLTDVRMLFGLPGRGELEKLFSLLREPLSLRPLSPLTRFNVALMLQASSTHDDRFRSRSHRACLYSRIVSFDVIFDFGSSTVCISPGSLRYEPSFPSRPFIVASI